MHASAILVDTVASSHTQDLGLARVFDSSFLQNLGRDPMEMIVSDEFSLYDEKILEHSSDGLSDSILLEFTVPYVNRSR